MRSLQALTEKPFVKALWADGTTRETSTMAVLEVDTKRASYLGTTWDQMTSYQKRKFENMLVLENPKIRLQFRYV